MGFREVLQKNQNIGLGVAGVILLGALVLIVMELRGGGPTTLDTSKALYSDDDGATFFIAPSTNLPPFDHNGKQAYLASVYRCSTTHQLFVAMLKKIPDSAISEVQSAVANDPKAANWQNRAMDVKLPGEKDWIPAEKAAVQFSYPRIHCPKSNDAAVLAVATDPDVKAQAK